MTETFESGIKLERGPSDAGVSLVSLPGQAMGWYFEFFFLSGFCSILYELVWLRALSPPMPLDGRPWCWGSPPGASTGISLDVICCATVRQRSLPMVRAGTKACWSMVLG